MAATIMETTAGKIPIYLYFRGLRYHEISQSLYSLESLVRHLRSDMEEISWTPFRELVAGTMDCSSPPFKIPRRSENQAEFQVPATGQEFYLTADVYTQKHLRIYFQSLGEHLDKHSWKTCKLCIELCIPTGISLWHTPNYLTANSTTEMDQETIRGVIENYQDGVKEIAMSTEKQSERIEAVSRTRESSFLFERILNNIDPEMIQELVEEIAVECLGISVRARKVFMKRISEIQDEVLCRDVEEEDQYDSDEMEIQEDPFDSRLIRLMDGGIQSAQVDELQEIQQWCREHEQYFSDKILAGKARDLILGRLKNILNPERGNRGENKTEEVYSSNGDQAVKETVETADRVHPNLDLNETSSPVESDLAASTMLPDKTPTLPKFVEKPTIIADETNRPENSNKDDRNVKERFKTQSSVKRASAQDYAETGAKPKQPGSESNRCNDKEEICEIRRTPLRRSTFTTPTTIERNNVTPMSRPRYKETENEENIYHRTSKVVDEKSDGVMKSKLNIKKEEHTRERIITPKKFGEPPVDIKNPTMSTKITPLRNLKVKTGGATSQPILNKNQKDDEESPGMKINMLMKEISDMKKREAIKQKEFDDITVMNHQWQKKYDAMVQDKNKRDIDRQRTNPSHNPRPATTNLNENNYSRIQSSPLLRNKPKASDEVFTLPKPCLKPRPKIVEVRNVGIADDYNVAFNSVPTVNPTSNIRQTIGQSAPTTSGATGVRSRPNTTSTATADRVTTSTTPDTAATDRDNTIPTQNLSASDITDMVRSQVSGLMRMQRVMDSPNTYKPLVGAEDELELLMIETVRLQDYLEKTMYKIRVVTDDDDFIQWTLAQSDHWITTQVNFELPKIKEVVKTLMKNKKEVTRWIKDPRNRLNDTDKAEVEEILKLAKTMVVDIVHWESILIKRYTAKDLHLDHDRFGRAPEIQIEVFTGYDYHESVYSFLTRFEETFSPDVPKSAQRAYLLWNNYLSSTIKLETAEYNKDLVKLYKMLRCRYGKVSKIIINRIDEMRNVNCTNSETSKGRAGYVKLIRSKMKQMQKSIEEMRSKGKDEADSEMYNRRVIAMLEEIPFTKTGLVGERRRRKWLEDIRLIRNESDESDDEGKDFEGDIQEHMRIFEKLVAYLMKWYKYEEDSESHGEEYCKEVRGIKDKEETDKSKKKLVKGVNTIEVTLESIDNVAGKVIFQGYSSETRCYLDGIFDEDGVFYNGSTENENNIKEDGRGDKGYDLGFDVRCFFCLGVGHELGTCVKALSANNSERRVQAIARKVCHYCLRRKCYARRMYELFNDRKMEKTKAGMSSGENHWDKCYNPNLEIPCRNCKMISKTQDEIDSKKLIKNHFLHILLCRCPQNEEVNNKLLQSYLPHYDGKVKTTYIMKPIPLSEDMDYYEKLLMKSMNVDINMLPESYHRIDTRKKDSKLKPEEREIFDTKNGTKFKETEIKDTTKIINESNQSAIYFLQNIKIGKHNALMFSDSGANGGCVVGRLAQMWCLEVLDPRPHLISTAGNNLIISKYGTFSLTLGPSTDGYYYRFCLVGFENITSILPKYNLSEATKDALKFDEENECVIQNEELPREVGGQSVSLLIGINNPWLLPNILFTHPCGLVVARSKIIDCYGSCILFGGTHDSFTAAEEAFGMTGNKSKNTIYNMAAAKHFKFSEMILAYRNSIRLEPFSIKNSDIIETITSEQRENYTDYETKIRTLQCVRNSKSIKRVKFTPEVIMRDNLIEAEDEITTNNPFTEERIPTGTLKSLNKDYEIEIEEETVWPFDEDGTVFEEDMALMNDTGNLIEQLYMEKFRLAWSVSPNLSRDFERVDLKEVEENFVTCDSSDDEISHDFVDDAEIEHEKVELQSNLFHKITKKEQKSVESIRRLHQSSQVDDNFVKADAKTELKMSTQELETLQRNCQMEKVNDTTFEDQRILTGVNIVAGPGSEMEVSKQIRTSHACMVCPCVVNLTEEEKSGTREEVIKICKLKKLVREWEESEELSTLVDYRCPSCQSCPECKKEGKLRNRSVLEEDEQHVIEKSIRIEYGKGEEVGKTYVKLPFIKPPEELHKIWNDTSNFKQAYAVLRQQLKYRGAQKQDIVDFMEGIRSKGFCQKLSEFPVKIQREILNATTRHYYPWRAVWKGSSITTPCRVVVDPLSSRLNIHLAKGVNTLQNLQQLLLDFRTHKHTSTFDIQKFYNALYIEEEHLCFQLFLWVEDLDPEGDVIIMVFSRAMYGVVSTGNQAETAIRRGAVHYQIEKPLGAQCILTHIYVDDGSIGADTEAEVDETLEEVEYILRKMGFFIKCVTKSGQKEISEKASSDGESTIVCGLRWLPYKDRIALAKGEMNFNKSIRGRKKPNIHPVEGSQDLDEFIIPKVITRRHAVAKSAELFDITGLVQPLKSKLKLDLGKLIDINLTWDDPIPEELLEDWVGDGGNFAMIQDARLLHWERAVVPENASELKLRILDVHDGSSKISAMAIYVGFPLKSKGWSCQLIFSRSSLSRHSVPRNELLSSMLGAQGFYVIKNIIGEKFHSGLSVGDSSISLAWETNPNARLKLWAFGRVRQIHRMAPLDICPRYHVPSALNVVDIATRGIENLEPIKDGSKWIIGEKFMREEVEEMMSKNGGPLKTYEEVCSALTKEQKFKIKEEEHPELEVQFINTSKPINEDKDGDISGIYEWWTGAEVEVSKVSTRHQRTLSESVTFEPENNILKPSEEVVEKITINNSPRVCENIAAVGCVELSASIFKTLVDPPMYKYCDYIVDPVVYGWKVANQRIAIIYKFLNYTIHRAHTMKSEHWLNSEFNTPQARIVRQNMEKKCKLCHPPKFSSINFGYIDSLNREMPETDEFEVVKRNDSSIEFGKGVFHSVENSPHEDAILIKRVLRKISTKTVSAQLKKDILQSKKREIEMKLRRESIRAAEKLVRKSCESVYINDIELGLAYTYYLQMSSKEVEKRLSEQKLKLLEKNSEGIWTKPRRLQTREAPVTTDLECPFFDMPSIKYASPVMLKDSPITYSLLMNLHWVLLPHRGVRQHERAIMQIAEIEGVRTALQIIKNDCKFCKIMIARTIDQEMANLHESRLKICPPFYSCQVDVMSPLFAYSVHNYRSKVKLFVLAIVCNTTSSIALYILEKEDTPSVVKAIFRHSFRYGFMKEYFHDLGSQLKAVSSLQIDVRDIELRLNRSTGMIPHPKATQAHEEHGRVERTIRSARQILEESQQHQLKQSVLSWETTMAYVANILNNLPLARVPASTQGSRGEYDVLTRNRLLLGRNNYRSPDSAEFTVASHLMKSLETLRDINRYFYTILNKNLFEYISVQKWNKSSPDCQIGDLVILKHRDAEMHEVWMLGIVCSRENNVGRPGKWKIKYRLVGEKVFRYTVRSSRELSIIHEATECSFNSKEHWWNKCANQRYIMTTR